MDLNTAVDSGSSVELAAQPPTGRQRRWGVYIPGPVSHWSWGARRMLNLQHFRLSVEAAKELGQREKGLRQSAGTAVPATRLAGTDWNGEADGQRPERACILLDVHHL